MTAITFESDVMPAACATGPARRTAPFHSLQIGMGWFSERPGGLERYYAGLVRHLAGAGDTVRGLVVGSEMVSTESGGRVNAVVDAAVSLSKRWQAFRKTVKQELSDQPPDVVASHHAFYTFPLLRMVKRLPLVVHFHGPYASECGAENSRHLANRAKLHMEKLVYRAGSRCIVLSQSFGRILHETYGVPWERISVVPGGVEIDQFACTMNRSEARARLGWPTDRPIVFSVRRLFRRMGLENLVDAASELRRRIPDVLILIAGKGWMADELNQRIKAAGLQDTVRLLGFVPDADLPIAYRAADLTIVPTVALEGFGLTTVESLAAGTPAIVTPVGGLPEVVASLSHDLIIPDVTAAALAAAMRVALTGELKLPEAGACRDYAREHFDWSNVVRRVRAVYREAAR